MIILLSNDDGIHSEGLHCLEETFQELGDVWTVAPQQPQNAVGRSITLHRPLRVVQLSERRFMVDGTPSDCVHLALNGLLPEKPAVVVSGINKGANMGDDIPYSGTVAAAFEATLWGVFACAVSLYGKHRFLFPPAARFTLRVVRAILANGMPPGIFLNINLPDTDGREITSFCITKQGKSRYQETLEQRVNPRGETYYWIGGDGTQFHLIPDSDADAVLRKQTASITPIKIDWTDYRFIDVLKTWNI
ncbi:MAG: 5'/3'-nucleotidase SurE [Desulfobacterota bacterium]|nr:5'/3'-nucleotidase SurE [Thermodesulfobacteriota bacterium]